MSEKIEDVNKKVQKWLMDEGYSIKKTTIKKAIFGYDVTRQGTPNFSVIQPEDRTDSIVVLSGMQFGEEEKRMLSKMPSQERETLLWNLRMDLLSTNCGFQFFPNVTSFTNIQVTKPIYYDRLSKNKFFETVHLIINAILLVIWSFQRAFGVSPDKQKSTSTYVA